MSTNETARAGGTAKGGRNGNGSSYTKHSTKRPKGQPIYTPDGHLTGYLEGEVFRKRAQGSRHMLRKPRRGWALDAGVFDELHSLPGCRIEIEDTEGRLTYTASVEHFARHCREFDYGRGAQVVLELRFWHAEVTGSQEFARQLALFG